MGCGCGNKGKAGQWQVVASNGRPVFTGNKTTADTVSKRYPGSKVEEVGKPDPVKPTPSAADAT
ncbi:hypothetical protein ACFWAP_08990 [Streptomyces goshikiensis]|uniref:hypothetical protein n=1 Tax=Streptomyces goshikiensis TaxID=1942 RepID=UPI003653F70E